MRPMLVLIVSLAASCGQKYADAAAQRVEACGEHCGGWPDERAACIAACVELSSRMACSPKEVTP